MQHLSPERIAALVDEPATADERTHFEQCALCRADFIAVRRIVAAAASERDRPITPLVPWQQLSTALRAEGVLSSPRAAMVAQSSEIRPISSAPSLVASSPIARRATFGWQRVTGMAAAAALLVSFGVVGGRMTMAGAPRLASGDPAAGVAAVPPSASVVPVNAGAPFRTSDDARASLHSAEAVYTNALLWLAAHDSALAPQQNRGAQAAATDYRERLEVLDAAMATARRALYETPADPVMNRYYLATLGAREVTIHRLTSVLPASQQVLEY